MRVNFLELNFSSNSLSEKFFLKKNNFWFIFSKEKSRFFGGFYFKEKPLRFIDEIKLSSKIREINVVSPCEVFLETDNNQFYFSLKEKNSLEIRSLKFEEFSLSFDSNFIFNTNPFLRQIKFEKLNSNTFHFEFYFENKKILDVLIDSASFIEFENKWYEKEMEFDKKRNSSIFKWWVLGDLKTKSNFLQIKILEEKFCESPKPFSFSDNIYLNFFISRFNNLVLENYFPAGFPWFFENWFRDELLSLYFLKKFLNQKKFIYKYFFNLEEIWKLNKPQGNVAADTLLLIFLNLSEEDFEYYFNLIAKFLSFWGKEFLKESELNLPPQSTWMDTLYRKEALEIYALYLKVLERLGKKEKKYFQKYNFYLKLLKEKIKNHNDINLIFVYFFLPKLLNKNEWLLIFENLFKNYFLDWGGLSTLSLKEKEFFSEHTGENPLSYHSGDSWYFLNNIFALNLKNLDEKKHKTIIEKIISSSLVDLLKDGMLGYSSELSSAKERKSEGSLIQTWSMASLFFLLTSFQNFDVFFKSLSY